MSKWSVEEGYCLSPGCHLGREAQAWNFALYSKHAESVTLLLYAEADLVTPVFTYPFDYLRNKSGRIWHCRIAKADLRSASLLRLFGRRPRHQGRLRVALLRSGQDPPGSLREVGLLSPRLSIGQPRSPRVKRRQGTAGPARRPARRSTGARTGGPGMSRTPSSTSCTFAGSRTTRTPA